MICIVTVSVRFAVPELFSHLILKLLRVISVLMCYYICWQCSTSCGLGAIWRTLACSTGSNSGCDPAKRPAPAQRCYLRPCSTWKLEEWSEVRLLVDLVYTHFSPVLFIYFVYMHSKRYLLSAVCRDSNVGRSNSSGPG